MHDYPTTEGRIDALREIHVLLSAYSSQTGRPAFPDALLFDILVEREDDHGSGADYTTPSADVAAATILDAGKGLSIDGYFWDALGDQTSDLLAEFGLAHHGSDDDADDADDYTPSWECDECGALIVGNDAQSEQHDPSCSLHTDNEATA